MAYPATSALDWKAVIFGPNDTPWEGGVFRLSIQFTEEFPNKPPTVKFVTRMFHPNIYEDGKICLDILQNQWSPVQNITTILTSIQSLLTDPNTDSPANKLAARMFKEDPVEYSREVMRYVELSWGLNEIEKRISAGQTISEEDIKRHREEKISSRRCELKVTTAMEVETQRSSS